MTIEKRKKGTKVNKKTSHGDSGRVLTVKGRSSSTSKGTSVYSALNGSFRVFYPIGVTRKSKRILANRVRSAVASMKD